MRANSNPVFKSQISDDWLFREKLTLWTVLHSSGLRQTSVKNAQKSWRILWKSRESRQTTGTAGQTVDSWSRREGFGWQQWKSSGSAEHQIKLFFTVHSCIKRQLLKFRGNWSHLTFDSCQSWQSGLTSRSILKVTSKVTLELKSSLTYWSIQSQIQAEVNSKHNYKFLGAFCWTGLLNHNWTVTSPK